MALPVRSTPDVADLDKRDRWPVGEVRHGRSGVPRLDPVRRIRRVFDALELATQTRPGLAHAVRAVRRVAIAIGRRTLPSGFERREVRQAGVVMADAPPQPETGPVVLMMSFRAWTSHVAWETTIAQGLRHRGARCEVFLCGGGLPICEIGWRARDDRDPCVSCAGYVGSMVDAARFPAYRVVDFVPQDEQRRIIDAVRAKAVTSPCSGTVAGVDLSSAVEQSLVWYFRAGSLPDTEEVSQARIDFLAGAEVVATAADRLLERIRPDVVVMVNGLFFEERIVRELALARGIRVVTYEVGAQRGTLFFSDGAPAPEYDISALWEANQTVELDEESERRVDALLQSRRDGAALSRRWYRSPARPVFRRPGRPLLALFTNVSWDTAVTGKARSFTSMFDWIEETIRIAAENPEIDLVIRVHPAESRWRGLETTERASDFVLSAFPELPANVQVIAPEESVDSYTLMDAADAVLVFASTIGLEAAAAGKPVVVAGMTHYRDRGFTTDVESRDHYRALLTRRDWLGEDSGRARLARKYAYLMLDRALIPFGLVVEDEPSEPVFMFDSVNELAPGRDKSLDRICDGILNGSGFVQH